MTFGMKEQERKKEILREERERKKDLKLDDSSIESLLIQSFSRRKKLLLLFNPLVKKGGNFST